MTTDRMGSAQTDHRSDRHHQLEPIGAAPRGVDQMPWSIEIAHDETCPALAKIERSE